MVDRLIRKHNRKVIVSEQTTLFTQREVMQNQRVSMTFVPQITNKIKSKFADYNLEIVFRSEQKLSCLLGSTKDKVDPLHKSGIYTIKCNE